MSQWSLPDPHNNSGKSQTLQRLTFFPSRRVLSEKAVGKRVVGGSVTKLAIDQLKPG